MNVCPVAKDPIIAKTQSKPVNNAKPLVKSSKRPITVVPKNGFLSRIEKAFMKAESSLGIILEFQVSKDETSKVCCS